MTSDAVERLSSWACHTTGLELPRGVVYLSAGVARIIIWITESCISFDAHSSSVAITRYALGRRPTACATIWRRPPQDVIKLLRVPTLPVYSEVGGEVLSSQQLIETLVCLYQSRTVITIDINISNILVLTCIYGDHQLQSGRLTYANACVEHLYIEGTQEQTPNELLHSDWRVWTFNLEHRIIT